MANIQGPTGNYYDKFHTTNPIAKYLMTGFLKSFIALFEQTSARHILEIGCGEGEMLNIMQQQRDINLHGFDVDVPLLATAKDHYPDIQLSLADAHNMAYKSQSFDMIIACEVLEHVAYPDRVLSEAARITRQYAIFSVPREPIWRFLNLSRGKYIRELGNTPGHIQHWSTADFVEQVSAHFKVIEVRQPLPWTMLLCETL